MTCISIATRQFGRPLQTVCNILTTTIWYHERQRDNQLDTDSSHLYTEPHSASGDLYCNLALLYNYFLFWFSRLCFSSSIHVFHRKLLLSQIAFFAKHVKSDKNKLENQTRSLTEVPTTFFGTFGIMRDRQITSWTLTAPIYTQSTSLAVVVSTASWLSNIP